jgi:hypothetical protein
VLVGFGGYARSGKDTAASILAKERGYEVVGFADPMRAMAAAINPILDAEALEGGGVEITRFSDAIDWMGYDAAKSEYPEFRRFLQVLGTEAGREILGKNIWVDTALGNMFPCQDYALSDTRFPNELAAIREAGGISIWIARPGVGPVNAHASDNSLSAEDFDTVVTNDGTVDDLAEVVLRAVDVRTPLLN